ncbi:hypothetical protein CY34DRAFT_803514 [Suillus luteus UH-Slu-Lm8-n1]|uniref:Uncharacterized protein n=1 Tax=Suillus luteus UH-Slu-Lm8-n1 TaxID=930992 RepID=A0A0D0BKH8_9AGAM|nr:hypothetical protein CY34DRAFT_803514 [Suillus luteus UH-Slu-Lm8-n1]
MAHHFISFTTSAADLHPLSPISPDVFHSITCYTVIIPVRTFIIPPQSVAKSPRLSMKDKVHLLT